MEVFDKNPLLIQDGDDAGNVVVECAQPTDQLLGRRIRRGYRRQNEEEEEEGKHHLLHHVEISTRTKVLLRRSYPIVQPVV